MLYEDQTISTTSTLAVVSTLLLSRWHAHTVTRADRHVLTQLRSERALSLMHGSTFKPL
jgi:hypothetical protein